MLARRASYDKKTLARQVIPLAPGYRTALSSRPALNFFTHPKRWIHREINGITKYSPDAYLICIPLLFWLVSPLPNQIIEGSVL